jgi:hypothetical protein
MVPRVNAGGLRAPTDENVMLGKRKAIVTIAFVRIATGILGVLTTVELLAPEPRRIAARVDCTGPDPTISPKVLNGWNLANTTIEATVIQNLERLGGVNLFNYAIHCAHYTLGGLGL